MLILAIGSCTRLIPVVHLRFPANTSSLVFIFMFLISVFKFLLILLDWL